MQKSGTDVLLDLLSIGTPPSQNSSPSTELVLINENNKSSVDLLDRLSSPSAPLAQNSSLVVSSPVMDLLDGISSPSALGTVSVSA